MPPPYSVMQCVQKVKILGQIMTTGANVNEEISDRLIKENATWGKVRRRIPGNVDVDVKLRLTLFASIITSNLLYRLRVIPISIWKSCNLSE